GFEAATVREIAAHAEVAFGTLFLYAKDKRDLLLLLYDDELEALTARATRRIGRGKRLVDQLIAFFTEFYRFFSKTPELARQMMREIAFTDGLVAKRIWIGVERTERRVAEIVMGAQKSGIVTAGISPEIAAHVLFSLYRTEIRFCLASDRPDVEGSLRNLRRQFELVCDGLRRRG
ncbi:MAG: TetR/AcrR family transcriptional regulator, partial [Stellaceae bacterium]